MYKLRPRFLAAARHRDHNYTALNHLTVHDVLPTSASLELITTSLLARAFQSQSLCSSSLVSRIFHNMLLGLSRCALSRHAADKGKGYRETKSWLDVIIFPRPSYQSQLDLRLKAANKTSFRPIRSSRYPFPLAFLFSLAIGNFLFAGGNERLIPVFRAINSVIPFDL